MKLTVVGLGYIGLPTSIMFAKHGVDVLGVVLISKRLISYKVVKLVLKNLDYKRFMKRYCHRKIEGTTTPEASDVFIIAVPTPIMMISTVM
ncbi:hypothetical protein ACVQ92_00815 [Staphylococcus aureus]